MFLDQLIRTLWAEHDGETDKSREISGLAGGDAGAVTEIGTGAALHGSALMRLGYSVEQVVHDYGDLCQAITDLALERDAPFSVEAFRTLNRCLDNAVANAVAAFTHQHDRASNASRAADENQRLGFLAHELRNYLHTAMLAFDAIETGRMSLSGSTGAMLRRNLDRANDLIGQTLTDVRDDSRLEARSFPVANFVAEAAAVATLMANSTGCTLWVPPVDTSLFITGNRVKLLAAVSNLLQNAFKFSKIGTEVTLDVRLAGTRILIEVRDHCGGLAPGVDASLFTAFTQATDDRRGVGLGLTIVRQSVEADGGSLSVRNVPGHGCVFTIDLPA